MHRRRLLPLLVAVLTLAAPAAAVDVKLWPLFRYARDDENGLLRWSAFGPLFEYSSTRESRDLRIRPFLWLRTSRGTGHNDRADILYPLISTRWQDDFQTFRFLLLGYRVRQDPVPATEDPTQAPPEWTSSFSIVPFLFYRHHPEHGTRLSVLPFYLNEDDLLGYEHMTAIMFPAYLRVDEPGVERRFHPFPFVSTVGGELGSGVRVWPFYGETIIAGQSETSYVMWPFHIRSRRLLPDEGWEEQRLNLPAYAAIDGPVRRTRIYGAFAYTHTVNTREGYESTGSPWPLVVRERTLGEDEYRTWRIFPFYGRSTNRGMDTRFWAWPAYRRKQQDVDDFHYERHDVGLVLWRHQLQSNETSQHEDELSTTFPVWRSERDDDRYFGQTPAFADSLLPRNRGVLAMWAPLYGLYRWDTRPNGLRDWNAGFGLVARENGELLGPFHLDLDDEAHDGG